MLTTTTIKIGSLKCVINRIVKMKHMKYTKIKEKKQQYIQQINLWSKFLEVGVQKRNYSIWRFYKNNNSKKSVVCLCKRINIITFKETNNNNKTTLKEIGKLVGKEQNIVFYLNKQKKMCMLIIKINRNKNRAIRMKYLNLRFRSIH